MVTREDCDAVRDGALACRKCSAEMIGHIFSLNPDDRCHWDPDLIAIVNGEMAKAIAAFRSAWKDPVRDHFYLNRPDSPARFGTHLTACELAFDQCVLSKWAFEDLYMANAAAAMNAFEPKDCDESGQPIEVRPVDIQSEWTAAVNAIVSTSWSKPRSPDEWLKVFKKLNCPMSLSTFSARRRTGKLRQHPDSTTKAVRLAIEDLPKGYSDSM